MKKILTLRTREALAGLGFISPWLIGLVFIFLFNLAGSIRYSFSEILMLPEGGISVAFKGFSNYIDVFTKHATFTRVLTDSVWRMIIDVPLITFFSLFIALILNRKFKLRGIVRVIFFLPVIMATSAVNNALDLAMMNVMGGLTAIPSEFQQTAGFNAEYVVNVLAQFGLPITILRYFVQVISMVYEIVRSSGVQILIFLAALQTISPSLYEVARIEGATGYDAFWKITLPMVSPLILTNVVYTIIDSYTQSEVIQLAYEVSFRQQNFGLGNAMSMVSTIVTSALLVIIGLSLSKFVYYHN
jgi:ABC-type sugar transport system permease subunit